MAFSPLEFTKSWENSADFPTYEPNETQVRADLQLLHEETRTWINRLVERLNDPSVAEQLPFQPQNGLTAQTVQAAILEVYAAIQNAAAGLLVDGSVTKEKLAAQLLDRTYGGRIWASMDTPGAAQNPASDFPVGQLWLRPEITLTNLAADSWSLSGGTAQKLNNGWLLTADGSQAYLSAAQTLNGGLAGQKVFVSLTAAALDDHLSGLTLYLNGMGHSLMTGGGVFETALDENGGLELIVQGQWPYAEAEASFRLENFVVVNVGAVEAALPDYRPFTDWPGLLPSLAPFEQTVLERQVFLQVQPGQWEQVGYAALPVSRGGTGHRQLEPGELLCGSDTEQVSRLQPGEEGAFLRCIGGMPVWDNGEQAVLDLGALRVMTGSYVGRAVKSRTLQLPVKPRLLYLYSQSDTNTRVLLANGITDKKTYSITSMGDSNSYWAAVQLIDDVLQFTREERDNISSVVADHFNIADEKYNWVALYGGDDV